MGDPAADGRPCALPRETGSALIPSQAAAQHAQQPEQRTQLQAQLVQQQQRQAQLVQQQSQMAQQQEANLLQAMRTTFEGYAMAQQASQSVDAEARHVVAEMADHQSRTEAQQAKLRELDLQRVAHHIQPLAERLDALEHHYRTMAAQEQPRRSDLPQNQRPAPETGLGGPPTRELLFGIEMRLQNVEKESQTLVERLAHLPAVAGETVPKIESALKTLRFLSDRIDSTDGLASTNNDVLSMHESVIVEIQAQLRDLMERMSGYESSSDVLNARFRNNSDLHVANMDRYMNEASAEFGRICRLVDALHRRVEDKRNEAEQ